MDTFVFIILPILAGIFLAIGVFCLGIGYLVKQVNRRKVLELEQTRAARPYSRELVGIVSELTVGIENGSIAIPSDFGLKERIQSACYRVPKGLK